MRYAFSAILGLALMACSGAHPATIRAGDSCSHCARVITEPRFAAQLVSTNGQTSTFHTPGCLAKFLPSHTGGVKAIFVTDYTTGELFPVSRAMFVRGKIDDKSGEHDFYAFKTATAAAERAKEESSAAIDWGTVRTLVAGEKKGN